jgi:hypothetical protein
MREIHRGWGLPESNLPRIRALEAKDSFLAKQFYKAARGSEIEAGPAFCF